jgi:hypothetical protein
MKVPEGKVGTVWGAHYEKYLRGKEELCEVPTYEEYQRGK